MSISSTSNLQGGNRRRRTLSTPLQACHDLAQSSSNSSSNRDKGAFYANCPGMSQTTGPLRPQRILDQPHTLSVGFPNRPPREIQASRPGPGPHSREDPLRSVDQMFNVYGERLHADLRDMHGLCTQLVSREKAKWYTLCAKVMMERDDARQKVNALTQSRNNLASSPSSAEAQNFDFVGRLASKRGRELPSKLDSTSPVDIRPKKSLQSPILSPSTSPTSPGKSTSPMAVTSPATTPPRSEFSPFEQRPVKRRRSCDVSPLSYHTKREEPSNSPTYSYTHPSPPQPASNVKIKQQNRTPSPLTLPTHPGSTLTSDFSHVDLMYVSTKGAFLCRACLLETSKSPSFEPKAFSLSASWDELRDHCIGMHPDACADVARLQPAEIFELRRRLSS